MRRFAAIASGLFACVTGCGDDGVHKLPDAPLPPDDSAIDAPASGTANITTNVRCCEVAPGTPQAGVAIAVVHADHTLGATATSDAQGKASVAVRTGDSVFAIYPEGINSTTEISTFVGVKPGDNLTFGEGYWQPPGNGVSGQLNVSWPAFTGASYYSVFSPCGVYNSSSTGTTISLAPYCQTDLAPMAFAAFGPNSEILASAYLPAAAFTPGTLPAITWTALPAPDYTVAISGLDAAISQIYFQVHGVHAGFDVTTYGSATLSGGTATSVHSTVPSATRTYADVQLRRLGTNGWQHYTKAQATSVSLTATMPWINGIAISPGEGKALWLQTGGTYDTAVLFLNWSHYDGKVTHYFQWNVIAPGGVTSLDLGTPPAALADFLPNTTDSVGTTLQLVDLSNTSTYDEVRAQPEATLVYPDGAVRAGTVPGANTSSYDSGEGFAFARRRR